MIPYVAPVKLKPAFLFLLKRTENFPPKSSLLIFGVVSIPLSSVGAAPAHHQGVYVAEAQRKRDSFKHGCKLRAPNRGQVKLKILSFYLVPLRNVHSEHNCFRADRSLGLHGLQLAPLQHHLFDIGLLHRGQVVDGSVGQQREHRGARICICVQGHMGRLRNLLVVIEGQARLFGLHFVPRKANLLAESWVVYWFSHSANAFFNEVFN